ncbi:hypothetical protein GH714_038607 [Hevea brasiliensis]|uniref:Uncharacterized protein n=1 Tax=Hevea brasiliensis TaxID=3981 RepID=A0A6A6MQF6_HEVBR|nr:hypothetical protein GH714_038607 [Hevea brasiliensis]
MLNIWAYASLPDRGKGWPRGPGQGRPRRHTGLELPSHDNVVSEQALDDPNHAKRPNETRVGKVPIATRVLLESSGGECQASMGQRAGQLVDAYSSSLVRRLDDPNHAKRPNETGVGRVLIATRVVGIGWGECQASMGQR